MQSILYTAVTEDERRKFVVSFCEEHAVLAVDQLWIDLKTQTKTKQSIGIEAILDIKPSIHIRPMVSSIKTVIFLQGDLLTAEAQNALLKMLEEPPEYVAFIICCETKEQMLPTIISRCKIISSIQRDKELSVEDVSAFQATYRKLSSLTLSDALELAEVAGKSRDEAIIWLEKIILAGRSVLLEEAKQDTSKPCTEVLRKLQNTYEDIKKTNANTRLLLEACFLSFL